MVNIFSGKKQNAVNVTEILLKTLNVKVSNGTIKNALEEHPNFPSLLSVSDCLTEWGVENQTYQIDKESFDKDELLFPFIAATNTNGGLFTLVTKMENGLVYTERENNDFEPQTEAAFLHCWTGIALHATATETSGEKAYHTNNIIDKFNAVKLPALIATLLLTIFLSINFNTIGVVYGILLSLKLVGLAVSILLLIHSINTNNPLIQNLCSLGKKNSCNDILKSDAAKVNFWLSWSEVGFFYFAGSFLSLLFVPSSLSLIGLLSLFALPYTVYSIHYQYKHKNWCVLCCAVQVILVLETITFLSYSNLQYLTFNFQLTTYNLLLTILCFTISILVWATAKPFLLRAQQVRPLKNQLKKFKYNTDAFKQVLTAQPKYRVGDDLIPIVLGNPNASTVITMVSNPFCAPCAQAHQLLDKWITSRNDIQLKIIFATADHDDDENTKVARHVSALSLLNDVSIVEKALNDWYKEGNKKYPLIRQNLLLHTNRVN